MEEKDKTTNSTSDEARLYGRHINRSWERQRKHQKQRLPNWALIVLLIALIIVAGMLIW